MKIAVIGASGRSGQAFVRLALEAGHAVTAGVRGPHTLGSHPSLKVVICDALVAADLKNLVTGQDAVVSLLGHVRGTPADMQTNAMQLLVEAMDQAGVKRLVSLTGTGARQSGDQISIIDRMMNLSIAIIDPKRVQDGINHLQVLKASNLDWTVIRVLKLTNQKAGKFTLSSHGPAKSFISRASVAQAILQTLNDNSFLRQTPIISH
jgi:putative NADH-flavin reductase